MGMGMPGFREVLRVCLEDLIQDAHVNLLESFENHNNLNSLTEVLIDSRPTGKDYPL